MLSDSELQILRVSPTQLRRSFWQDGAVIAALLLQGVGILLALGEWKTTSSPITSSAYAEEGNSEASTSPVPSSTGATNVNSWEVQGVSGRAEKRLLEARLKEAVESIASRLGDFKRGGTLRILDKVNRPGQALAPNNYWTGRVFSEPSGWIIELSQKAFETDSDLRFYLAHARIRERGNELQSEVVRVGLAHYLRSDDGFDAKSYELYEKLEPLTLVTDFDKEKLTSDWRYRDRARGSAWGVVYYLIKSRELSIEQLLSMKASDLPDPSVLKREVEQLLKTR